MQAFGHQISGFADPDRANMFEQPTSTGGEIAPSPPPVLQYQPMAGRADRLSANIPGAIQTPMGFNADHMIGTAGR